MSQFLFLWVYVLMMKIIISKIIRARLEMWSSMDVSKLVVKRSIMSWCGKHWDTIYYVIQPKWKRDAKNQMYITFYKIVIYFRHFFNIFRGKKEKKLSTDAMNTFARSEGNSIFGKNQKHLNGLLRNLLKLNDHQDFV